jgi:hypothetical protein
VDESFFIPNDESPELNNMRTSCWRAGQKYNRRFGVVELPDGTLQVGRLPDS